MTPRKGQQTSGPTPTAGEVDEDDQVTHEGDYRKPTPGPQGRRDGHLGALEDETVPVIAPTSEDGGTTDEGVEPRDEMTPG